MSQKNIQEKLFQSYRIVAYTKLKISGKKFDKNDLEIETARIERCCDHYYYTDKQMKLNYFDFISDFLKENFKELISGDKFSGYYLEMTDKSKQKETYLSEMNMLF